MKNNINTIIKLLEKNLPNAKIALHYQNNFELLIAVMLSAQSTDVAVNKATPALFAKAPTPQAMMGLSVETIKDYIKTIGLSNTKARNVHKTCTILVNNYQGQVPEDRAALENLPGVGRKTANVVLAEAFGWDCIAVDTHVFRVSQRIGLVAPNKDRYKLELELMQNIPKNRHRQIHHWLIHLGRSLCQARKPNCQDCFLQQYCAYVAQGFDLCAKH